MFGKLAQLASLVALTAAAAAAPAPTISSDPSLLLREAIAAPLRISYVGEVQSLDIGESQSEASIYRIEHVAPGLTRCWYLAPRSLFGDSIVIRGHTTYNVDVQHNRLIVDENDAVDDQVALQDNYDLMTRNYRVVSAPDETVAGRSAHVLLLVNKHTGETTMRIYIDAQTGLVLQKERFGANGSLTSQTRFEQLRYTAAIPNGVFTLPSGLQEVKGRDHGPPSSDISASVKAAGFAAHSPRYLPNGFVPVTGDVADVKGVRTLHLLYSDGIRTVSLFENAKGSSVDTTHFKAAQIRVGDDIGSYVEEGPLTLLAWVGNGIHYTMVGELSRDELVRIATSVEP
jgi:negative regulator of sigma E activity